jgi:hypothetical protein
LKFINFKDELHANLSNPDHSYAVAYIESAMNDSTLELLRAFRELANAHSATEIVEVVKQVIENEKKRMAEREEWVERGSSCG